MKKSFYFILLIVFGFASCTVNKKNVLFASTNTGLIELTLYNNHNYSVRYDNGDSTKGSWVKLNDSLLEFIDSNGILIDKSYDSSNLDGTLIYVFDKQHKPMAISCLRLFKGDSVSILSPLLLNSGAYYFPEKLQFDSAQIITCGNNKSIVVKLHKANIIQLQCNCNKFDCLKHIRTFNINHMNYYAKKLVSVDTNFIKFDTQSKGNLAKWINRCSFVSLR